MIGTRYLNAGIEKDIAKYPWSSYNEYLVKNGICDTKIALSLFAEENKRAVALFQKFNSEDNNNKCLEYEELIRIDDKEATKIIIEVAGVENTILVQN